MGRVYGDCVDGSAAALGGDRGVARRGWRDGGTAASRDGCGDRRRAAGRRRGPPDSLAGSSGPNGAGRQASDGLPRPAGLGRHVQSRGSGLARIGRAGTPGAHLISRTMPNALMPATLPGLFITGTDTGVGKTVITGAIADWFHRRGSRVGVLKPVATGCVHQREGLVSEDAEFLAHCAEARFPLDVICPERYAEPLAPSVAAERAGRAIDWQAIQRSVRMIEAGSDVLLVEGVGGIMVPLDESHTVLDLAQWLRLPAVIVA